MFLVMLSLGVILPHLAYYAEELGASAAQIGFLISVYAAMKLFFAPVWGRLSDRPGRKPAILPTVMAYVVDVTTEEYRGKEMGLMGATIGLDFIAGPGIDWIYSGEASGDGTTLYTISPGLI